jgi:hypothetical protein
MRIIGGHDYYDSALAFGRDSELVFVRNKYKAEGVDVASDLKKRLLNYDTPILHFKEEVNGYDKGAARFNKTVRRSSMALYNGPSATQDIPGVCEFDRVMVLFAGKAYTGLRMRNKKFKQPEDEYITVWSLRDLEDYLYKHFLTLNYDRTVWRGTDTVRWGDMMSTFFDVKDNVFSLMIEHKMSIAIVDKRRRSINIDSDGLKNFDFFTVMDAYTAMQELSMWVGGILPRPGPKMVDITDEKVLVKKHGFDKHSFRHPFK